MARHKAGSNMTRRHGLPLNNEKQWVSYGQKLKTPNFQEYSEEMIALKTMGVKKL